MRTKELMEYLEKHRKNAAEGIDYFRNLNKIKETKSNTEHIKYLEGQKDIILIIMSKVRKDWMNC